jgi:drug/metabolite transporter (DMT)-like permease
MARVPGQPVDAADPAAPRAGRDARPGGVPVPVIMTVTVLAAGAGYPVTDAALRSGSPAFIATARALLAGAVVVAGLLVLRRPLPRTRRDWALGLAIGTGNVTLVLAGISEGTDLAGPAITSVLLNSAPFVAALFARVFLGERVSPLRAAGIAIGFVGIVVIVVGANNSGGGSNVVLGVAFCMMGAVGWAAAGVAMRYLSIRQSDFDVGRAMAAQFIAGGMLLVPYLLLSEGPWSTNWTSASFLSSLTFLVVGAQVITYVGFYVALTRWTSARVFAWTFLAPVTAVVIAAGQGELPSALTTAGLVTVIAGVTLVNHPRAA